MALTTDIRIFPQKELFAVDMAELMDTAIERDGIIQGCGITFNSEAGTLTMDTGRIIISGRLGIITESGSLAAPVLSGTSNVTCYLVAACNLSTLNPFTVEIITPATYEEYQQRKEDSADVFNAQDGFDFIVLGTVSVNPTSGKIVSWTPDSSANVKELSKYDANRFGGNKLPAGTNIDNLTAEYAGWWSYIRSEVSGTFILTDTTGLICHAQGADSNAAMQILRSGAQGANNRTFFVRHKLNGVWGSWQHITSSTPTPMTINLTNNNYCNYNDVTSMHAYRKGGWLWLKGNLHVTYPVPQGTTAQIGTITGWMAPVSVPVNVPERSDKGVLTITLSYDGKLSITNNAEYKQPSGNSGYYNFLIVAPSNDGQ